MQNRAFSVAIGLGFGMISLRTYASSLHYVLIHFKAIWNLPFCPDWSWERFWVVTLKGRYINLWMNEWWWACPNEITFTNTFRLRLIVYPLPEELLVSLVHWRWEHLWIVTGVTGAKENIQVQYNKVCATPYPTLNLWRLLVRLMYPYLIQSPSECSRWNRLIDKSAIEDNLEISVCSVMHLNSEFIFQYDYY